MSASRALLGVAPSANTPVLLRSAALPGVVVSFSSRLGCWSGPACLHLRVAFVGALFCTFFLTFLINSIGLMLTLELAACSEYFVLHWAGKLTHECAFKIIFSFSFPSLSLMWLIGFNCLLSPGSLSYFPALSSLSLFFFFFTLYHTAMYVCMWWIARQVLQSQDLTVKLLQLTLRGEHIFTYLFLCTVCITSIPCIPFPCRSGTVLFRCCS